MTAPLLAGSGVLLVVAALAPNTSPALLWALLPAAVGFAAALLRRPAFAATGAARGAAATLAGLLLALVALSLAGAAAVAARGLEPTWVSGAVSLVGGGVVVAAAVLGAAVARRGGPRPAGLLLVVAIPVGLALDMAVAAVLPVGFFLEGATVALLLLGVALVALARAARVPKPATGRNREPAL